MNEQLLLGFKALDYTKNCRVQSTNHQMQERHVINSAVYLPSVLAIVQRYDTFQARFLKRSTYSNKKRAADYGALALSYRLGNCFELACACGWFLSAQKYSQHAIVDYPENDHVFNVLGQPAGPDGTYPSRFALWKPDSVIVDAWADIACYTREYPSRWRARMQNWQIMGRSINEDMPVSSEWYNLVDQPKVVLTSWN